MTQKDALTLLFRQLKDIRVQADKILSGENSHNSIENFSRYSAELKSFIENNVENEEVLTYLKQIPQINYSRTEIKLWQFLVFPSWWIILFINHIAKNKAVEDIKTSKEKYVGIEFLLRDFLLTS